MQPQSSFYDPDLEGLSKDMQIVLKGKPFKPLRNKKTGNFFSYSYDTATRNSSANANDDIEWVDHTDTSIPKPIRDKIKKVRELHNDMVQLHLNMKEAVMDEDKSAIRKIKRQITELKEIINQTIYPEAEREYVESKEAERFRLEQQGELKLDAASIAALTGNKGAGSTADLSIAEAKLQESEKKAAEMQKRMDLMQKALDEQAQGEVKPVGRKKTVVE